MKKNIDEQTTGISKVQSLEEIAEFWENHSLADYWDKTHKVDFEIRTKQRRRITLAPDIYEKILDQARIQGILPETLVNVWLAERIQNVK